MHLEIRRDNLEFDIQEAQKLEATIRAATARLRIFLTGDKALDQLADIDSMLVDALSNGLAAAIAEMEEIDAALAMQELRDQRADYRSVA